MSAGYTKGPWEWQTPMGEHCPWIVQAGKRAYEWEPIATLGDCTEDGPSPRSSAFQRIQADARLIAAAPELLEALQLVWDAYGFDPSIDSSVWQTVRAAIAKATAGAS